MSKFKIERIEEATVEGDTAGEALNWFIQCRESSAWLEQTPTVSHPLYRITEADADA